MKKLFLFIAVAALAVCCTKNEQDCPSEDGIAKAAPEFYVSVDDSDTKTHISGAKYIIWHADDHLSVFPGRGTNHDYVFTGGANARNGVIAEDTPVSDGSSAYLDRNYAVYPYNDAIYFDEVNEEIVLSLPYVQSHGYNSFGNGANVMVAATEDTDDRFFRFKNVCGYLVLNLYGTNDVKDITLKGNNGELISCGAKIRFDSESGRPVLTMDEGSAMTTSLCKQITLNCALTLDGCTEDDPLQCWFVVPPTDFEKGFTITIENYNDGNMVKSFNSDFEIKANTIYKMDAFKVNTCTIAPTSFNRSGGMISFTYTFDADYPSDAASVGAVFSETTSRDDGVPYGYQTMPAVGTNTLTYPSLDTKYNYAWIYVKDNHSKVLSYSDMIDLNASL